MNNKSPVYTPLEAFALFQELNRNFQNGLVIGTFRRISETLQKTPLISEQDSYDASRLSPEYLQDLALQLLREEKKEEKRQEAEAAAEKNNPGLSPNSRKRKLQSPPLSTFQEALEQTDKLPNLVEKLYLRYRESLVKEIREDERRYEELQRELAEIERGEWDERPNQKNEEKSADQGKNGAPIANNTAPTKSEGQVATAPTSVATPTRIQTSPPAPVAALQQPGPRPTPVPVPIPVPPKIHDPGRRIEPPHTPQPSQEKKVIHPTPSPLQPVARHPGELRHVTPDNRPQEPVRPASSIGPGLQHPQGVQGYNVRPGSATPQPLVTDGLQRPDGIQKSRSPAPIQSNQPNTPTAIPTASASLKWEPPYQPHHQSSPQPSQLSHPHQLPHHPHQPNQPPLQPAHQPPYQTSHQSPHQPPLQPQPSQHPSSHQTPIPSPRPPYGVGITRPPSYSPQATTALPQFPQNYVGGRQTPGQYAQPSRAPVQGSASASPSVLLPPQNAGQIPPSLQSLPLNATPDGAGQQAPQRRPPSIPAVSSPGPNIAPNPYTQHQGQHVPAQTPVRPPVAISATHPATTPAKPPVPPAQWRQSPRPTQPSHSPHTPIPTTPAPQQNQPQPPSRSYSSPYNQQAQLAVTNSATQRPLVPPLQTPIAIPHPSQPLSATSVQTPIAISPHIVRGHGTRWTSTPTPGTPIFEDRTAYFNIESPAWEPISPPSQPAQLPKPSPKISEKKDAQRDVEKETPQDAQNDVHNDTQKTAPKPDVTVPRPRGRPRITPKPTPVVQSEETPAEPDLSKSTIKNEEATPQALEDIGDAAGENSSSQVQSGPSQSSHKRKRQDSPPNRAPPAPATHVLWTRSFNKISQSALDQIISHRHANMFAHPVKPRTAPGYFEIVLRPQDLKGIQKAITAGSKAAAAAVATMPDVDSNATNVWIPISVDLVPPRGIINIAQLERELVHMFANAIMYNPDPYRGFGPSFLRSNQRAGLEDDGEDYRGYEVDENGVVKDTRSMFGEVEKLLSDLRNEVERNAPPPTGVPPSASRSMSVAGGEANTTEDDDEHAGDSSKRRKTRG
ncbi:hypothetical protein M426DRAFT_321052 [Hypoxylon sp. CI-4A]|nr:hypothetical protein M426DRAFT_321052 [Hypoxylon sp. CI-4A]